MPVILVIDPGHGGKDAGAIGINGIKEKDVVLQIAQEMLRLNETKLHNKFEIYLTRNSDTLISLKDRAKLAKNLKADFFISLHCNHSPNPNAQGVEVYASLRRGTFQKESVYLAYLIQKALIQKSGIKSRGIKFANFQVLRETVEYCPGALVEFGFLSNGREVETFIDSKNIRFMTFNILKLIGYYLFK